MFRLLSQNEIDLVYTLDHHIYDRNYVIAYEAPVSCHFFCSSAHPLASRESVPVKQLIHESFILTERNTSYQKLLDQHLTSLSLEITPFLELSDTSLITQMLQKGWKSLFCRIMWRKPAIQEKKLARIPVPDLNIEIWKQILTTKTSGFRRKYRRLLITWEGRSFSKTYPISYHLISFASM